MGRAIVRDPQVFLFDEPLSNLDAKLRVQMRTEIKELHQRLKTTTVYVTHDQIEAMTMADKIVVMHDGIVEQIGTPLELYDNPANQFVAGFIGSPAMNFIKGTLKRSNGGAVVETPAGLSLPTHGNVAAADGQQVVYGVRPNISKSAKTAAACRSKSMSSSRPAPTPMFTATSPARSYAPFSTNAMRSRTARSSSCSLKSPPPTYLTQAAEKGCTKTGRACYTSVLSCQQELNDRKKEDSGIAAQRAMVRSRQSARVRPSFAHHANGL
jgi:ABC-type sugar transport system ATPase subunit